MSVERNQRVREERGRSGQPSGLNRRTGAGTRIRTENPAQRVARKPDLDSVPSGWDPIVWHLTLLFEQCAEKWEITLAAGRPVIYAQLEKRINTSGIKEATDKQLLDSHGVVRPWQDLVQAMIVEYWTQDPDAKALGLTHWDSYAADEFTSFEMFRDISRIVRRRAADRRAVARIEARKAEGTSTSEES